MKTNKSYTKRIRVTPKGKLLVRASGQNHFNAKERRANQLANKKPSSITLNTKDSARFLSGKSGK